MTRIGFLMGAVVLAFVLATANTTAFANSCCGVKKDAEECNKENAGDCAKKTSASESSDNCPVCGQAADSKGQQTDVKHAGETVHLCCEGCATAYNKNPDKYSKVEKPKQSHQAEPPKKKKQRGESYY
ncbi:MAG: hypothetical protein NUV86_13070 [Candidatus Scalindua sp.]|nr:hypothetical protein [Candidatus Scalindua sp.]MCR4345316.1 hypothetical protein [Candidatus Scalindua sp.]